MGKDAATPPGLVERIRDIVTTEVSKLLRSGLLRNASISEGGLTIRDGFLRARPSGAVTDTFYVGPVNPVKPDGQQQPGLLLRREDGSTALALYDGNPALDGYFQHWTWYDRGGNVVFSEDATSGQGLARPWLPIPLYPGLGVTTLPASTAGTSFTALLVARAPKQQPRLLVTVLATTPAGTTGEVRLMVNGAQVGSTVTAAAGASTECTFGPAAVAGAHMSELRIDVEARVTAGAGPVAVFPLRAEGRQS